MKFIIVSMYQEQARRQAKKRKAERKKAGKLITWIRKVVTK